MTAPRPQPARWLLRPAEWLTIAYFVYVASITPFFAGARPRTGQAWLLAALVTATWVLLSRSDGRRIGIARDWLPLLFTLIAYRQMDWFTPATPDHRLDFAFVGWDRWLLDHGLSTAIESAGPLFPSLLESCYLLVYAVAPISLWILLKHGMGARIGRWWIAYLAGTLGAYSLLPWFLSQPPRAVFAGDHVPHVSTWLRQLNLSIVGGYGIHSSVFPSAHVSSVFSAAWGLSAVAPERPALGRCMALYACGVALASVYGRYHYAADVVAGFVVSFLGIAALRILALSDPTGIRRFSGV